MSASDWQSQHVVVALPSWWHRLPAAGHFHALEIGRRLCVAGRRLHEIMHITQACTCQAGNEGAVEGTLRCGRTLQVPEQDVHLRNMPWSRPHLWPMHDSRRYSDSRQGIISFALPPAAAWARLRRVAATGSQHHPLAVHMIM